MQNFKKRVTKYFIKQKWATTLKTLRTPALCASPPNFCDALIYKIVNSDKSNKNNAVQNISDFTNMLPQELTQVVGKDERYRSVCFISSARC